jgi:BlaI family penicillinase repressor
MAKKPTRPAPRATESELKILQALWRRGPSTVREVWDELASAVGYTTVLKLLQIMRDKGLVVRDEARATHVYSPAVTEAEMQEQMVGGLIDRAFGGSASQLMLRALSAKPVPPAELQAIRKLIDQAEKRHTP